MPSGGVLRFRLTFRIVVSVCRRWWGWHTEHDNEWHVWVRGPVIVVRRKLR